MSEEDKRDFNPKYVIILFLIIISAIVIGGIGLYAYYMHEINTPLQPVSNKDIVSIEIKKGMSVDQISQYLVQQGILRNPFMLKVYLSMHKDKTLQAGYYRIDRNGLTLTGLVDQLQKGSFEHRLTFIEGWRVEEYYDYLKQEMGREFADGFMKSKYIKEGYMFPDTYVIDEEKTTPNKLASWMRNTFDKKVGDDLFAKAELRGLSKDEVVVLASIVEREISISKDRPIVAGILIKRLENGWALQADSTVQYAKGDQNNWWPKVTRDDLRSVSSSYNTYINKGLPPAPICNPSLDSIKAVVNYKDSEYWFYVTGKDGITHYAKTLEEHNANVRRFLSGSYRGSPRRAKWPVVWVRAESYYNVAVLCLKCVVYSISSILFC